MSDPQINLYEVSSDTTFIDAGRNTVCPTVFVMATSEKEAKERAIVHFKAELDNMERPFDELEAMQETAEDSEEGEEGEETLEDLYDEVCGLEAIHRAACGHVDVKEVGWASGVLFDHNV